MRWIWIDRILELHKGQRCVALKNISLAEEVVHDHFARVGNRPPLPVMPNSLIIEGMAQTAGIMVGHANDFAEKVILAKITRATFTAAATPGRSLRFTATMDRLEKWGASTSGIVELLDPADGSVRPLASIDLMFSHIDNNRAGLEFPKHNFVFTDQFMDLLARSGFPSAVRTA
jgi:3-hydroxyacyl-[acyl-carrier-protein] dehydratase